MEITTIKLCAAAVTAASAGLLMRELRREFEIPIRVSGLIFLSFAAVGVASPVATYFTGLLGASPLAGEAASVIVRSLGIAYLTRAACEICRDMGSGSLAGALETVGKLEIVLLALPLLGNALDLVGSLLLMS